MRVPAVSLGILLIVLSGASRAEYPTRPVRLIVGVAPGRFTGYSGAFDCPMAIRAARTAVYRRKPSGGRRESRYRDGRQGSRSCWSRFKARSMRRSTASSTTISPDIAPVASISRQTLALEVSRRFRRRPFPTLLRMPRPSQAGSACRVPAMAPCPTSPESCSR